MYQYLRVKCFKYQFNSIDEMDDRLRNLSSIEFRNISKTDLQSLKDCNNTFDLVRQILYLNALYVTRRFSKRYQKFVKGGGSDVNSNTSRSVVDIFMIALHYKPETKLIDVYQALCNILGYTYLNTHICSTIHKRVYPFNVFAAAKNEKKKLTSIYNPGILRLGNDELGVNLAIDYVKEYYFYEFNGAKLCEPIQNTVSST